MNRLFSLKEDQSQDDDPDIKTYKEMMQRDKRRWMTADKNKDKQLSKEEFADFLHPEEAPHMQDIVITETIEDIDKDGDGKISLQEYIGKNVLLHIIRVKTSKIYNLIRT